MELGVATDGFEATSADPLGLGRMSRVFRETEASSQNFLKAFYVPE